MDEFSINETLLGLGESSTLAINQCAKQLKDRGEDVVHFGFGQSPFSVPNEIQQRLVEYADKNLYLSTQGLLELREAIAEFLKQQFNYCFYKEDIFIAPGSKQLLFNLLMTLQGRVIIPVPSWVSYGPQAQALNKEIVYLPCCADNNYCLSAKTLNDYCFENVNCHNVLILNSPNNPTGQLYTADNLYELSQVCKKYKITVISDEIYALTRFNQEVYPSMVHYYPEGTVVTSGLSKSFAAGGYRLGFAAVPRQQKNLKTALLSLASETYSAVSAPIQYAAIGAYKNYKNHNQFICHSNVLLKKIMFYCWQYFCDLGLNCLKPQGGFYLILDFSPIKHSLQEHGINNSAQLAHILLKDYAVATLPGSDFYLPRQQPFLRISPVDFNGASILKKFTSESAINDLNINEQLPQVTKGCQRIGQFVSHLKN